MGLLDGLIGNVLGSALGGGTQAGGNPLGNLLGSLASGLGGQAAPGGAAAGVGTAAAGGAGAAGALLSAALSMVQSQGGVGGLLDKLRQSGLGQHADSWVGTGPNLPVTSDQLNQAVGSGAITAAAAKLGVPAQQAGTLMAKVLPELINQLTPNGQVPGNSGGLLADGLKILQGMGH